MSPARNRTLLTLLSGCALSFAPLAVAVVVTPAPGWACDPQPNGDSACQPAPAEQPAAPPLALPPFPALSPSDVDVHVTPGTLIPPSVGWSLPQFCLPTIETGIPFVGYQPCI